MVDEPVVETMVDPPDTMPVTRASVEMATGPPAPAPPAPPELLWKVLASSNSYSHVGDLQIQIPFRLFQWWMLQ